MIRHVVLFRFEGGCSQQEIEALLDELEELPQRYPALKRWCMGPNLSTRDDTFTHAFSVEVDTERELLDYLNSDYHEHFVSTRWRPLIADRAIVSWEC